VSTYAQLDDVTAYGVVVEDPTAAQNLLDVCEREIDNVVTYPYGPLSRVMTAYPLRDQTTGLRLDPTQLLTYQAAALARAVAAQFEYHIAMGEDFFRLPQVASVQNPEGGGYNGTLPRLGPKALRELQDSDLLSLTGTTESGRQRGVFDWQRNLV
jgi:hypothetical protein